MTDQTPSPGTQVMSSGGRRRTSATISSVTACSRTAAAAARVCSGILTLLAEQENVDLYGLLLYACAKPR